MTSPNLVTRKDRVRAARREGGEFRELGGFLVPGTTKTTSSTSLLRDELALLPSNFRTSVFASTSFLYTVFNKSLLSALSVVYSNDTKLALTFVDP
jgi:hypothetical protein